MLKVGDKIRIKTWEEMLDNERVYLVGNLLRSINNDGSDFIQEMKKYCDKEIVVEEDNIWSLDEEIVFYDGWKFFPWSYEILEENKTKVVVEQSETGQNLSLFPNKTPILSDGNIVENKIGNRGVYINKRIRYAYGSSDELDDIVKIYKIKDDCKYGYDIILNSSIINNACDVIWEKPEIEQSLENLELGTKIKVKFKEDGKIKESIVGNLGDKRILIYDDLMACLFDTNKHEILEIIK